MCQAEEGGVKKKKTAIKVSVWETDYLNWCARDVRMEKGSHLEGEDL